MPQNKLSPTLEALRLLPPALQAEALSLLSDEEAEEIEYSADFWLRPEQHFRPGSARYTWALAGRFFGKNVGGANAIKFLAAHPDLCDGMIGIAGRTVHETNQDMVRKGILEWSHPSERPRWRKSDKILVWPSRAPWHGCEVRMFSGEKPEGFRGPNMGAAWTDESPHWKYPSDSFQALDMMVRVGPHPWILSTTTPLGTRFIVQQVFETDETGMPVAGEDGRWKVREDVQLLRGSSYANLANAPANYVAMLTRMEGTRLGLQEIHGEVLLGVPGAPWSLDWFRSCEEEDLPELARVVIGVDPSGGRNEVGIVAVGADRHGRYYVLEDASGHYSPEGWARAIFELHEKWSAHPKCEAARFEVVEEDNYGGNLVSTNIEHVRQLDAYHRRHWRKITVKAVRARKSKIERARLVAPLWELSRVYRVGSPRRFVALEMQMTSFDPDRPERENASDRMDALVWSMLALTGDGTDRGKGLANVDAWRELAKRMHGR